MHARCTLAKQDRTLSAWFSVVMHGEQRHQVQVPRGSATGREEVFSFGGLPSAQPPVSACVSAEARGCGTSGRQLHSNSKLDAKVWFAHRRVVCVLQLIRDVPTALCAEFFQGRVEHRNLQVHQPGLAPCPGCVQRTCLEILLPLLLPYCPKP